MTTLVNVDNFARAETDRMAEVVLRDTGGINRWTHNRLPTPFDHQPVIRQNRDTLYSGAIVDVSRGAQLTIPDTVGRYISAMIINQDHYVPQIIHEPGVHRLTKDLCGTPYVLIPVRILVDPNDPNDIATVNALQDQLAVDAASAHLFTHPDYEPASFTATHDHLIALSRGLSDYRGAFGRRGEVDPVRHLLGSASAWGGFPESEAIYLNIDPGLPVADYQITVDHVPVDALWSITVYDADGFMRDNSKHMVSVNSITATPNNDGSVTVRFGDGDQPNTIPTTDGWNYMVRMYRPQPPALDRSWTFPTIEQR